MYTVIRFTVVPAFSSVIAEIGNRLNEIEAGTFVGLRKAGDGFTCEVAGAQGWIQQRKAVGQFVTRFAPVIEDAVAAGVAEAFGRGMPPKRELLGS